ncbi:radical SAM/SPASM domain-containing protein [Parablautia muri]|uniref:Radical SAM protein n=1 Tax=Parablautia muri TaxID=2320879 RepID=A0A9X5BCQ4_9FIRM|nr:radical SAM/SPASM domain-containing protein [Parablautia muri]NBJ91323.1 radical SAM protein [Parablautia muri]
MINRLKKWCRIYFEDKRNISYINKLEQEGSLKIREIEIETVNRCNGKCSFCPVNANEPQREYAKMSTELFYKIIAELKDMNYSGTLSIFSNNEPFLDDRIIDFYKYARNNLPSARLSIFTNGTLMKLNDFKEIVNYLDYMVIDNYNDDLEVLPNLKEIFAYLQKHKDLQDKVNFVVRPQDQVRTSRGGQAPNKKGTEGINELCLLPFRMMVIRPTGKVSLCCNDALGKYTLGDISQDKIIDIWNSTNYEQIRQEMLKNRRKNLKLCKNCDTTTVP